MSDDVLDGLRAYIAAVVRDELAAAKPSTPDEFMSTGEAAKFASVATGTIRRWVRLGKLRDHRAGRRVRVSRKELHRLLREGKPQNDDSLTPEQLARKQYG